MLSMLLQKNLICMLLWTDNDCRGLNILEEMGSDAAMSETLQPYNILSLEAPDVSDGILDLAEVKAARSEIMHSELLFRKWWYQACSMPRKDNVRNQRERLVLLLANAQSQVGDEMFTREAYAKEG